MPLDRCNDCGGLVKGKNYGFEAICTCYAGRRPKRSLAETGGERKRREQPMLEADISKL